MAKLAWLTLWPLPQEHAAVAAENKTTVQGGGAHDGPHTGNGQVSNCCTVAFFLLLYLLLLVAPVCKSDADILPHEVAVVSLPQIPWNSSSLKDDRGSAAGLCTFFTVLKWICCSAKSDFLFFIIDFMYVGTHMRNMPVRVLGGYCG